MSFSRLCVLRVISLTLVILLHLSFTNSESKDPELDLHLTGLGLSAGTRPNENVTSCIIKEGGHIYDLSELSQKKYWVYSELAHNESFMIFLLSICHPVQDIKPCQGNSGVCFVYMNHSNATYPYHELKEDINQQEASFVSGGKMLQKFPEVTYEGALQYSYEGGDFCSKESDKKYRTEIHLKCPLPSEEESTGPVLMSSPPCLFIFIWMTFAACPKLVEATPDPCIIKFSSSEYPLNLHSLHAPTFYNANGINSSFEINICGPIQNGSCPDNTAVCDTSNSANPRVLATSEEISFDWQEDALILSYKSSVKPFSVNIYLHCDRTAFIPRFFFSSNASNFYNFSVYTITVCSPQSSDCLFDDKQLNVYDLRPLHKKNGHWEVIGRKDKEAVLFNLNVCGPINDKSSNCPPGPIGACQQSVTTSGSRNLGYITSNPVVNEDRSITLLYTGGDSCREGVRSSSTRISFFCSTVSYPPVFLEATASCEHLFEWRTPAACPVNVVSSNDCYVTDPLFGHNFDLNTLRNDSSDYEVSNGNESFRLNMCGPLVTPCGKLEGNTAVCQVGKEKKSGGVAPAEFLFNDGTLMMKFSNGTFDSACRGGKGGRWGSQILFMCSHEEKGPDVQYMNSDRVACVHHFFWHTKAACPPHLEVDCTVREGNLIYDLTPLSNPNLNEIFITFKHIKKYVMNVCRSVIHSKESRCAYDAGACLIDISHENRTLNLGRVTRGPFVERGQLKVKYDSGDPCNGTRTHSTLIEFECTEEQYISYPILYASEKCLTLFKWSTMHACPRNASEPADEIVRSNCTAVNPLTNYVFDMNSLREEKPHELPMQDGSTLLITACGNVKDPRCSEVEKDSGACIISKDGSRSPWSGGKWNKALRFHMWSTYLEYEGGSPCGNGFTRATRISFICQEGDSVAGPILISEDEASCTFFVNWYTEEACERHIRCFAHSWERTYDLSPLIRSLGNYEVQDPTNSSFTYLINVCRPLNPVIGVNCHPGSSSCLVRKNQEPLGLGHPILNPIVVTDDKVHLMYAHGSSCPGDPGFSLSSRIIFVCNRTAGAGTPQFLQKTECQTLFTWDTSLVCPPTQDEVSQCQIAYEAAKTNVDLSPLRRDTPYVVSHGNQTFRINVCGGTACGEDAAVCSGDGVSYGRSAQSTLRWDHHALLLTFFGGNSCEGAITGSRSTGVVFECDPKGGLGTPEIDPVMDDLQCTAVFIWRTNLTCLESLYSTPKDSSSPSPLPTKGGSSIPNSTLPPSPNASSSHAPPHPFDPRGMEDLSSQHTWVSVLIATVVLVGVVAASVYVVGRSAYGRRLYTRAKRTLARKGYAHPAENDTLLQGETAYVYRVDEDEQVLRV